MSEQQLAECLARTVVGRRREIELVVAALAADRHILLEGPPGTGKSTLLRSVAHELGIGFEVVEGNEEVEAFRSRRLDREPDVPLDVRVDPYRNPRSAVLRYVEEVDDRWVSDQITVLIPEFVVRRLGAPAAQPGGLFLEGVLLFGERVVVVSAPYQVPRTPRRSPSARRSVAPAPVAPRPERSREPAALG